MTRLFAPLLLTVLLLATASSTNAGPLPWRTSGRPHLTPVRWTTAQAPTKKAPQAPQAQQASTRAGQVPEGGKCSTDDDCVAGTYCDRDTCVKVRRPFNALYLFYRSDDGRFTEAFGIYWHQSGVKGYQVVFPFYWHFWEPDQRTLTVFPFFYSHRNTREGIRSYLVTLFQYRTTPNEKNYRLWPVVFWTDYGDRGAGLTVLPLFHYAREGSRRAAVIPLLLSGFNRDPERGYSQGLLAGLYYWHREGDKRATGIFPFFYSSRATNESFTWVLPLNFHWREGKRRTLLVLPLFYQRRSPEKTLTLSLVPPLYHRREGDQSRLFALPFFYHRRDGARTFFWGGLYYHRTWPRGYSWGLVPLLFAGRTNLTSHQVVFPVFWRFTAPGRNITIGGPVFYYRRRQRSTAGIVPLAYYHRDRKAGSMLGTIIPLFYYGTTGHGRRARIVSPLFLYERDEDAQVTHWGLLAPPFYRRRDADREVDTLIPLVLRWHDKVERSTTWVFGPVVYHDDPEGGTQVVLPLYWRFSDRKTGATTSILFPLWYRHRRPDRSHFNLLFPFFLSARPQKHAWSAGIFPILYFGARPGHRHAVLFPAFWHLKHPGATTTVLGPVYLRTKPDAWHFGIPPLLYAGRDGGSSYQVLFPALWHLRSKSEGYNTFVFGPGFYSRGRNGRVFGLLPLFAGGRWKGSRFATVLPPLFYRSSNPDKGESFTVAGPYIGWKKRDERGHSLIPVAYLKKGRDRTTAFIVPFFFLRKRPRDRLLLTPLGGFHTDDDKQVAEGMIGPFVWHKGPEARGFALVPFLYHWRRPQKKSRTTVIFPIGVKHDSPEQRALVWFPFFWRLSSPQERSLVIFPIYWRLRQDKGLDADVIFPVYWNLRRATPRRRLLVLGPFFWARSEETLQTSLVPVFLYRRSPEGSTLWSLPFIYRHRDLKQKRTTGVYGPFYLRTYERGYAAGLVPIFMRKNTPDSQYTILVPIYWDVGNAKEGRRLTFWGPFFHRRKPGERAIGLAPIFYTSWDTAGGKTATLIPIFYYRSEVGRRAIYTPLFGFDRSPLRRQLYVGPYFHRRSDAHSLDILFPLLMRYRDHIKGETTFLTIPYYGRWSKERSFHLLFPLYWRQRRIDSSNTVVFPFYWDFDSRYASRTSIFFPLLLYHRDHVAKSTSIFTPPGIWLRFRPKATDGVVFPLFWHFGGDKRSTTLALPLYYDFKRHNRRTTILFPLFWRFAEGDERTTFVVNTLYQENRAKKTYNLVVIPLLQVQRKRPQDIKVEALGGIFGYERVGRNRLMTIFFYTFPLEPTEARGKPGEVQQQKAPQLKAPQHRQKPQKKQSSSGSRGRYGGKLGASWASRYY